LFGWRREARRRMKGGAGEGGSAFVPVVVETAHRCADAPTGQAQPGGSLTIEIVIGAATVRVTPGIDAATLTRVLRAVRAAT